MPPPRPPPRSPPSQGSIFAGRRWLSCGQICGRRPGAAVREERSVRRLPRRRRARTRRWPGGAPPRIPPACPQTRHQIPPDAPPPTPLSRRRWRSPQRKAPETRRGRGRNAASAASRPRRTAPCACRGSIRFVHDDCQLRWLTTRQRPRCEGVITKRMSSIEEMAGMNVHPGYSYSSRGQALALEYGIKIPALQGIVALLHDLSASASSTSVRRKGRTMRS
ncbi:hypothetical protein ACQJBY_073348 [Aegilops geniculata]